MIRARTAVLATFAFTIISSTACIRAAEADTAKSAKTTSDTTSKSEDDETTVSDSDKPTTVPPSKREWGDTSIPPDRRETFFQDEFVRKPRRGAPPTTNPLAIPPKFKLPAKPLAKITPQPGGATTIQLKNVKVRLGDEVLFEEPRYRKLIEGKRIGLITNPSGMDSHFIPTVDKIASSPLCKLTALFAPEHGVRGDFGAGDEVKNDVDPYTSTPIYSLHGKDELKRPQSKPRPEMLSNVDVLMFDIQDIGNRSYTFIGTMKLCMQAAAENDKDFIVLDRPNPMGGELVDGNVLDPRYATLVGAAPVAYLYGLTPGELAQWYNEHENIHCRLTVVPMKGWKRSMKWWDTGLPWIPTSTHMQHAEDCWYIALTGTLGELHGVNEGVGYPAPFRYVGAPWINSIDLARELNSRNLPGLYFRPAYFQPYYHLYKDKKCGGVQALITDFDKVRPVEAGTHIIEALHRMYPEQKILSAGKDVATSVSRERVSMFNKVMGTNEVRLALLNGYTAEEINSSWKSQREAFEQDRKKYFLYK